MTGGSAMLGVERQMLTISVLLRVLSALVGGSVALIGLAEPADPAWVLPAVAALLAWTALFSHQLLRRGPRRWLILADLAAIAVLCLLHERLVPAEVLTASAGTGWVDPVVGSALVVVQLVTRQPFGLLAILFVASMYTLGTPGSREAPVVLVLQGLVAAALLALLHRAAGSADAALARQASVQADERARSAARTDELDQQRRLHDTVLATLTMVSTGGVSHESASLRRRALADLRVVEGLGAHPGEGEAQDKPEGTDGRDDDGTDGKGGKDGTVRLDLVLRTVVLTPRPGLPTVAVEFDVPPLQLPRGVVSEISQSVAEALSNVARHAGTDTARLVAESAGAGVDVEVRDLGRGFGLDTVPAYRRGVRESIVGRMTAVGGSAEIVSSPGAGTRVLLRWRP
ncbi:sensor histidine kinase [Streptomyces sp. CWNU-52B]|uniref:sensor histidine kinase n=1 Tax=unclassified Streptomyces TaxID=2593676 RepID=UPI0039BFEFE1